MSIPNKVQPMRSGIVGTLADDSPKRVIPCFMDYTFNAGTENHATPSRAVCFVDADKNTVEPGGSSGGIFAGLILGNERVPSNSRESWYATGDQVEVIQMGSVFVNIDDVSGQAGFATAAVGDKINYEKTTGKLAVGTADSSFIEIKGAVITDISPYVSGVGTRLAKITLNGPVPA